MCSFAAREGRMARARARGTRCCGRRRAEPVRAAPGACARSPAPVRTMRRPAWRASESKAGGDRAAPSRARCRTRIPGPVGRAEKRHLARRRRVNSRSGPPRRCGIRWRDLATEDRPGESQALSVGHADLLGDEIEAGDHLRHGMLDLQARVHLEEVEPPRRREDELHRAGVLVADGPRDADRRLAQRARARRDRARRTASPR